MQSVNLSLMNKEFTLDISNSKTIVFKFFNDYTGIQYYLNVDSIIQVIDTFTFKLIDENTLTFLAVHELAHVMTESVGHTKEFWQNFKFLLKDAVKMGIYTPVDYKKKPKSYCGMNITDNPYYDL